MVTLWPFKSCTEVRYCCGVSRFCCTRKSIAESSRERIAMALNQEYILSLLLVVDEDSHLKWTTDPQNLLTSYISSSEDQLYMRCITQKHNLHAIKVQVDEGPVYMMDTVLQNKVVLGLVADVQR